MFAYIERDSIMHDINPIIKLIYISIVTVIMCLSYYPVLPVVTIFITVIMMSLLSRISLLDVLYRSSFFVFICISFIISMLILRGCDYNLKIVFSIWIFNWSERNLVHTITLGFRMLSLVMLSQFFVSTTKPSNLILSLIIQCKLSVVYGFAVMSTYRFLPELDEEVKKIRMAQEIRGIPWNEGIFSRIRAPFRILVPLICIAARRGERIACAMESRGVGRYKYRTYYKRTSIKKSDIVFLLLSLIIYAMVVIVLVKLDVFRFSFAAIQ